MAASDGAVAPTRRWTARRALVCHAVLLVWLPGCGLATWWQVDIARSGDALGWVYAVMWPCFALFATVLWWNLIHDDPDTVGARAVRRIREQSAAAREAGPPVVDEAIARAEAEDDELAAYNAYLATLGRRPEAKTWRRP
ncbi:MAG: hypothetical protein ACRDY1_07540 [Acidimicrobiales bacterium]